MRSSDWSSDVCSSDLPAVACAAALAVGDPGDGACGLLDAKRGFAQRLRIGFAAVVEIQVGNGALEQHFLGRDAGIGILGPLARLRAAAGDQLRERPEAPRAG